MSRTGPTGRNGVKVVRRRAADRRDPDVLPAQLEVIRAFAAGLKAARLRQGFSLADMAARSGLTRPAISRLENGLRANPTLDTLFRYAAALGLEVTLSARSPGDAAAAPGGAIPARPGRALP
jgi:DNA-binding XRE family transcriptional regulator